MTYSRRKWYFTVFTEAEAWIWFYLCFPPSGINIDLEDFWFMLDWLDPKWILIISKSVFTLWPTQFVKREKILLNEKNHLCSLSRIILGHLKVMARSWKGHFWEVIIRTCEYFLFKAECLRVKLLVHNFVVRILIIDGWFWNCMFKVTWFIRLNLIQNLILIRSWHWLNSDLNGRACFHVTQITLYVR